MSSGTKYVNLTIEILPEEVGGYSAICIELHTASDGETIQEALENISDAIALHLETLEESGELEHALARAGVKIRSKPSETVRLPRTELPEGALITTKTMALSGA